MKGSFGRMLRHAVATDLAVKRALPADVLARIEQAVEAAERTHRGEIRFAVEGGLEPLAVWRGLSPRERALEVFSTLHVWDTEENTGVLIYLQLVDRDVEIVADRGIARHVHAAEWEALCQRMETAFRAGNFEGGLLQGIGEVGALLEQHFPAGGDNANELVNRPVVL